MIVIAENLKASTKKDGEWICGVGLNQLEKVLQLNLWVNIMNQDQLFLVRSTSYVNDILSGSPLAASCLIVGVEHQLEVNLDPCHSCNRGPFTFLINSIIKFLS